MTGFGQASSRIGEASLLVEAKTLNSKFLDLSLRLPRVFSEKELEVRNIITEKFIEIERDTFKKYINASADKAFGAPKINSTLEKELKDVYSDVRRWTLDIGNKNSPTSNVQSPKSNF